MTDDTKPKPCPDPLSEAPQSTRKFEDSTLTICGRRRAGKTGDMSFFLRVYKSLGGRSDD